MRCVHCHKFFSGSYCPECWNRLAFASLSPRRFVIGAPLKISNSMIDDAIESIMEVLEDETRDLSSLDRMEVLNGVRERIDELTEAAIIDEQ